ncbi:hypothetical protein Raf01_86690 [Rugosimonospora africana]|uniref:Arylsulfotransferase ASST n=1 Tax=Rugosimonospora africana TaxID=556532 RepID=A0A8J3R264_9ACTN|nr:hypothetical protein Raf01_86690 [Rugosimonospora africana]
MGGAGLAAAAALGGVDYGVAAHSAAPAQGPAVRSYLSRTDLRPPAISVKVVRGILSPGLLLLTPTSSSGQHGPMIIDETGEVLWFRPLPAGQTATNFQVQTYRGEPVLTWWEGKLITGYGSGEYVVLDRGYRELARLSGGPGSTDLHEFQLTDAGTALSTNYQQTGDLLDCVIREVDVATGRPVVQWRASDHVSLSESYQPRPGQGAGPWDFFHANAVAVDSDGNLLISSRHLSTVLKVHRRTGAVIWRLGGKRSDFRVAGDARFHWQHDVRRRSDGTLSVFDNGAGATTDEKQSRGLILDVDESARTATVRRQLLHPSALSVQTQGSVRELPGAASFVGWGQQPYFSEYACDGSLRYDAQLLGGNYSYRAFRANFEAAPIDTPAVAITPGAGGDHTRTGEMTVHVSWNGATRIARWMVRSGPGADALTAVALAHRSGFETPITVERARFVAIDALDSHNEVLGSSATITVASALRA